MSKKINYYKIGSFAVLAILIALLLLVVLGSSQYFKSTKLMETYFDESVQGLQTGSPVKYQGITIGSVKKIELLSELYQESEVKNPAIYHQYVYVEMSITDPSLKNNGGFLSTLPTEIAQGLRARIASESITGNAYLEITYLNPKENPTLAVTWSPHYTYIPSASSTMSKFVGALGDVFVNLQEANIADLVNHLDSLSKTLDKTVNTIDISQLNHDTTATLQALTGAAHDYQQLAAKLTDVINSAPIVEAVTHINELAQSLQKTSGETDLTLKTLRDTLQNANEFISQYRLQSQTLIDNTTTTMENLRELSQMLNEYPSLVLFGDPPPVLEPGKL